MYVQPRARSRNNAHDRMNNIVIGLHPVGAWSFVGIRDLRLSIIDYHSWITSVMHYDFPEGSHGYPEVMSLLNFSLGRVRVYPRESSPPCNSLWTHQLKEIQLLLCIFRHTSS